jgi:hypothetical protein
MKKDFVKVILCLVALLLISRASASTITISATFPGTASGASPGSVVVGLYRYALFVSGLLAFGAIVYGGIRYAWARGNPSGESEAKAWIWSALLGLLLLAGAYVILYTINPALVNLSLPGLPSSPAVSS